MKINYNNTHTNFYTLKRKRSRRMYKFLRNQMDFFFPQRFMIIWGHFKFQPHIAWLQSNKKLINYALQSISIEIILSLQYFFQVLLWQMHLWESIEIFYLYNVQFFWCRLIYKYFLQKSSKVLDFSFLGSSWTFFTMKYVKIPSNCKCSSLLLLVGGAQIYTPRLNIQPMCCSISPLL